jgi:hypothetical protein
MAAPKANATQDVALDRPTQASSEAPGHNGAGAIDGNPSTYWSASDDKRGAWWQVDLEQPHTSTSVQTTFPTTGNYRYRIEGALDGNTWTQLVDQSNTQSMETVRTDTVPPDLHFQMARITFTAVPAGQRSAIVDVKIQGKHRP